MDEIILKLPELLSKISQTGVIGLILSGLFLVVVVWAMLKYNSLKNAAAENATNKDRADNQASNPVQNANAESDAAKAESDIERMIKNGDSPHS